MRASPAASGPLLFKVEQQNSLLLDQELFPEETNLPFKFWRDGIRQFIFRAGLRLDELEGFDERAAALDRERDDAQAEAAVAAEAIAASRRAAAPRLAKAVEVDRLAGGTGLPHDLILGGLRPVLRRVPAPEEPGCWPRGRQ